MPLRPGLTRADRSLGLHDEKRGLTKLTAAVPGVFLVELMQLSTLQDVVVRLASVRPRLPGPQGGECGADVRVGVAVAQRGQHPAVGGDHERHALGKAQRGAGHGKRDVVALRDAQPWVGAFRTFENLEEPTYLERSGYPVGLCVQADGDQYDRYEGGVAMAERRGHHLVVVEDSGDHEVYAFVGNEALDDIVNAYLVDGVLPEKRVTVPGSTPRPDIPADA